MSSISLRSGSCRQTSSTCAPRRTCSAADLAPPPRSCPSAMSCLNLRLPSTLVRSPTITGRVSWSITSVSMPETAERRTSATRAGAAGSAPRSRRSCGCAPAVVPQQPPMMLIQPSAQKRSIFFGQHRRQSRCSARPRRASPAFGKHEIGKREISASVRRWSVMKSGPVAQLSPMAKQVAVRERRRRAPRSAWPASIVPIRSRSTPRARSAARGRAARSASSMPSSAALTFSVSCWVSRKSTSAPPSTSPTVCSAIGSAQLVEGDAAGDRDGLACPAPSSRRRSAACRGGRRRVGDLARQARRGVVDLVDLVLRGRTRRARCGVPPKVSVSIEVGAGVE